MNQPFNDSKYTRWYNRIVERARERQGVNVYCERHHVIPKSLGGNNDVTNMVVLTAREHFICHWLLTKMVSGVSKYKMQFALNALRRSSKTQHRYQLTSTQYQIVKKSLSEARSLSLIGNKYGLGKTRTIEQKIKQSANQLARGGYGPKSHSQETKDKIAVAITGMIRTEETKQKMRKPKPEGFGDKIRISRLGKKHSASTLEKMRRPKKKVTCPKCGKEGGSSNMTRYHFENCKSL